jgi:phage-related protein
MDSKKTHEQTNRNLPANRQYGIFTIMDDPEAAEEQKEKPVHWVASSRQDLRSFPHDVRRDIGFALSFAQRGGKHPSAKPLKGFKGAGVLEIVEDHQGDTYRAVYTVRFAKAVYVLHTFMKKSKSGIKTPKHEIDLIAKRLKAAEMDYNQWLKENTDEDTKH